jgi:hypothetical protein
MSSSNFVIKEMKKYSALSKCILVNGNPNQKIDSFVNEYYQEYYNEIGTTDGAVAFFRRALNESLLKYGQMSLSSSTWYSWMRNRKEQGEAYVRIKKAINIFIKRREIY